MTITRKAAVAGIAAWSLFTVCPPAVAQHDPHAAPATEASDEVYMAELERQLTALLALVYEHADFDAVEASLTRLIRDNPEAIGGDADAFATHVSAFLAEFSEQATADPQAAAAFAAAVLLEAHLLAEAHHSR